MRKALVVFFFMVGIQVPAVFGQEISPVVQQCSHRCRGEFSVRSLGVVPIWVTLEPRTLEYVDGKPVMNVLDGTGIKLELSRKSVRISPAGSYRFSFKLDCGAKENCAVEIFASMLVGRQDGVTIKLMLPEVVYSASTGKPSEARATFRKANGLPDEPVKIN